VLDFTSALYLGLHHPKASLRPWEQLTTGRPAALEEPPGARAVAHKLAALVGCEGAVFVPSTLHFFWDLFGMLAHARVIIYMDAGTYPIAGWGIERAVARGVPVRRFPHHDVEALRCLLTRDRRSGYRPVVVADGYCPGCGKGAPIAAYAEAARTFRGYMLLDDTQALGILGHSPTGSMPYGKSGGGSLRWSNISGPEVLIGSSLAKGFGVPIAILAGSAAMVQSFQAESATLVHCSPPSMAVIHATEHALAVNHKDGDALRLRLAHRVHYFRMRLRQEGFFTHGGLFPVQTLEPTPGVNATKLHERLLQAGIRTVLHQARQGSGARLSFLLTALHTRADIDLAVCALEKAASEEDSLPCKCLGTHGETSDEYAIYL
jgi:8-amino-7-oxononanoate synthase